MKTKKLLKKVREYLDADHREQVERSKSIRKVLKELKEHERELKVSVKTEPSDEKRQTIQNEIDVLRAQRKKGVAIVKAIRRSSKRETSD